MQPRDILIPLTVHFGFLPVIMGLLYQKKMDNTIKIFWWVLIYSLLNDLICYWLYYAYKVYSNNLPFINVYDGIESIALLYILNKWLYKGAYKRLILTIGFLLSTVWIYAYKPWTNKFFEYSPMFFVFKGIALTLIIIFILYKFTEESDYMLQSPKFWILAGLFIQFFCPLMVNALAGKYMNNLWWINNVISLITFIIYTKAFSLLKKTNPYAY